MLHRKTGAWVPVLALVFGFAGYGLAGGKIEEFSAEQVHINPQGKVEGKSMLYAAPKKMRMEMNAPNGRGQMIAIVRQDTGLYWMVLPEKRVYMERQLSESEAENLMETFNANQTEEDLGTETVNGFMCSKKRIITKQNIMGRDITSKVTVWKSDRLDWPIRTQTEEGGFTELRNIKEGRQPEDLFEPPGGYRKASNMMGMFN